MTLGVSRPNYATGYHLNSNQNPQDCAAPGDRTLSLFTRNNEFYFATSSLNPATNDIGLNINFTNGSEGVWCLIYHGYSRDS